MSRRYIPPLIAILFLSMGAFAEPAALAWERVILPYSETCTSIVAGPSIGGSSTVIGLSSDTGTITLTRFDNAVPSTFVLATCPEADRESEELTCILDAVPIETPDSCDLLIAHRGDLVVAQCGIETASSRTVRLRFDNDHPILDATWINLDEDDSPEVVAVYSGLQGWVVWRHTPGRADASVSQSWEARHIAPSCGRWLEADRADMNGDGSDDLVLLSRQMSAIAWVEHTMVDDPDASCRDRYDWIRFSSFDSPTVSQTLRVRASDQGAGHEVLAAISHDKGLDIGIWTQPMDRDAAWEFNSFSPGRGVFDCIELRDADGSHFLLMTHAGIETFTRDHNRRTMVGRNRWSYPQTHFLHGRFHTRHNMLLSSSPEGQIIVIREGNRLWTATLPND
ncbi:MAG: hypothetical protein KDA30_01675 [Phycisphaerales bacterium]|nr:hypothetical protein [Phycisphaerales bacterium]